MLIDKSIDAAIVGAAVGTAALCGGGELSLMYSIKLYSYDWKLGNS